MCECPVRSLSYGSICSLPLIKKNSHGVLWYTYTTCIYSPMSLRIWNLILFHLWINRKQECNHLTDTYYMHMYCQCMLTHRHTQNSTEWRVTDLQHEWLPFERGTFVPCHLRDFAGLRDTKKLQPFKDSYIMFAVHSCTFENTNFIWGFFCARFCLMPFNILNFPTVCLIKLLFFREIGGVILGPSGSGSKRFFKIFHRQCYMTYIWSTWISMKLFWFSSQHKDQQPDICIFYLIRFLWKVKVARLWT